LKKSLFTILITLLLGLGAQVSLRAQTYFGIKGTYSIPFNRPHEIKYDDADDLFIYRVNFIEQDYTPTVSLVTYYRKELIYLQGELAYRRAKTRFSADNFIDLQNITNTSVVKTTHSLDIPLIAGIRLDRFKLGVGPMFSIILSENELFGDIEFFEERRSSVEAGFGFQTGIVLYRLHVDLTYQFRFNGVGDYLYWRSDFRGFSDPVQFLDLGLSFFF
jgi:hypothetical protein